MTGNRRYVRVRQRLVDEVHQNGVNGAVRLTSDYLKWRMHGSPAFPDLDHLRYRYLELLKSCLIDEIYGSVVSDEWPRTDRAGMPATKNEVLAGTMWPSRAHTMIGRRRLENIQYCVETVIRDAVPGDLIETGVWRGGATIFMRALLDVYGETARTGIAADSFEGLPPPDTDRYPMDAGDTLHEFDVLSVGIDEATENFAKYGLLDDNVLFVKGLFEDTLPNLDIGQLAVLRLDGDMYGSTIQVLEALFDKVSPGGFVIIDDYALPGCRAAVDDFRRARSISDEMIRIDWTGCFWRKS